MCTHISVVFSMLKQIGRSTEAKHIGPQASQYVVQHLQWIASHRSPVSSFDKARGDALAENSVLHLAYIHCATQSTRLHQAERYPVLYTIRTDPR